LLCAPTEAGGLAGYGATLAASAASIDLLDTTHRARPEEELTMLQYLLTYLQSREEGQDLVEYALLLVLIAIVVAAVLPGVATAISNVFNDIVAAL
jgi:Flp pilus assembly pilin Flp